MLDTRLKTPTPIGIPFLDARALVASRAVRVIDLRSPSEFAEDHVPGAINVPLFDDVQRALVGTLYARSSPEMAFEQGRAIVAQGIRALVEQIAFLTGWRPSSDDLEGRAHALTEGGFERLSSLLMKAQRLPAGPAPVVFHCWRGGLRSRSVVAFVREQGLESACLLDGGYKAYRAEVARAIEALEFPPAFVLRGLTGVGKTLVLREIAKLRPAWVVDLEALASHRSSLLGMVGLQPVSQKRFESLLFERMRSGMAACVVFEGESRKVGDVILPPRLWKSLCAGTNLQLVATPEQRVRVLIEDYLALAGNRAELLRQLPLVEARMERKKDSIPLARLFETGRIEELVLELLERYYDPLYRHGEENYTYAVTIDARNPARAARECVAFIEAQR